MNDTDVQATNTDCKPKRHKKDKLVLQICFEKILTQERVALGKIRFCIM